MSVTRITRTSLPDHDGTPIVVRTPQGDEIGVLEFDGKGNSRWTDSAGQPSHRRMTSKRKHRKQ